MGFLEKIDIPSAKERFMNNEGLYKRFLYKFPESTLMAELEGFLAAGNVEEAFKAAHTIKGMVGNLSLYGLMHLASDMTEILRAGNLPKAEDVEKLRNEYEETLAAVNELKETDAPLF